MEERGPVRARQGVWSNPVAVKRVKNRGGRGSARPRRFRSRRRGGTWGGLSGDNRLAVGALDRECSGSNSSCSPSGAAVVLLAARSFLSWFLQRRAVPRPRGITGSGGVNQVAATRVHPGRGPSSDPDEIWFPSPRRPRPLILADAVFWPKRLRGFPGPGGGRGCGPKAELGPAAWSTCAADPGARSRSGRWKTGPGGRREQPWDIADATFRIRKPVQFVDQERRQRASQTPVGRARPRGPGGGRRRRGPKPE